MRRAFLCLLLAGCAHTTLFDPSGSRIAEFQGDYVNVTLTRGAFTFHADSILHSTATLAGGNAFAAGAAGIGVAAVGIGAAASGSAIAPTVTRSAAVAIPTVVSASKAKQ